jgi:tetratricopeptide (TPR) repeat protein
VQEAAAVLDGAMKLQAFQAILAYNLALCYYQLGDRTNALEYLRKAKSGTVDPSKKQKLLLLQTFFTTSENGLTVNDTDKGLIVVYEFPDAGAAVDASLEDEGGAEESFSATDTQPSDAPSPSFRQPATQAFPRRPAHHSDPIPVIDRVCAMRRLSSKPFGHYRCHF